MESPKISRKLQGQVALVTGAGRGIGASTAQLLAAAGAAVVLAARSEEEIEGVASRIVSAGGRALPVVTDVSDLDQVEEAVEAALTQFDRLDILINNAATVWPIDLLIDGDPDEWAYNIHVNLVGVYHMMRNTLPLMVEQRYGRIVNVTSGAARSPMAGMSAYCAAKAGLDMLTRNAALELKNSGVTVNALDPGLVETEMQADLRSLDGEETDVDLSYFHRIKEEGALKSPDEVAPLIYWLVGPWSRKESGEIFRASDEKWTARVRSDIQ